MRIPAADVPSTPTITIDWEGTDTFVCADGKKIARRGDDSTAEAGKWISLEPGVSVSDSENLDEIEIKFPGGATLSVPAKWGDEAAFEERLRKIAKAPPPKPEKKKPRTGGSGAS
jgi:hypothetical protein